MSITKQIANHFRQVHFGGNWTDVNLKDTLEGMNWQQATSRIGDFNTIAILVFHTNYYTSEILKVLKGAPLQAHDKLSFDAPAVNSQEDWNKLLDKTWKDAEEFSKLIEKLPEEKLRENFCEEKYGNYYRNIHGVIEHLHYHLGQIVLIKKAILWSAKSNLESEKFYHGTKANLKEGDLIEPGFNSNYGNRKKSSYIYLTATLDAATWGAELAAGDGPGRIYIVEPTGPIEDDPNLTDKKFPGNPTKSYRSKKPLRVLSEVTDWQGHSPEQLNAMREHLDRLKQLGIEAIED